MLLLVQAHELRLEPGVVVDRDTAVAVEHGYTALAKWSNKAGIVVLAGGHAVAHLDVVDVVQAKGAVLVDGCNFY